jgi:hypothetical protein
MKATDRDLSHGAIIGKPMSVLKEGKGMVLVLVNLHKRRRIEPQYHPKADEPQPKKFL